MKRIQQSPLAGPEKAALDWCVRRLPAWMTPDLLTAIGVLGSMITFAGYALAWTSPAFLWLASFGLLVNWFGDSLDGTLARFRRVERPRYGFFLDQSLDVVSNLFVCIGIGISPFVRLEIALLVLTGYHMLTIYSLVRACIEREFHLTLLNSGPTELRVLIVLMNTMILAFGAPKWTLFGVSFAWCDVTTGLFGLGFVIAFLGLVRSTSLRLRSEDDSQQPGLTDRL